MPIDSIWNYLCCRCCGMISAFVFLLCLSPLYIYDTLEFVPLSPEVQLRGNTFKQPYDVEETAILVRGALSISPVALRDRIAVVIVFSFPIMYVGMHERLPALNCALHSLYENVKPYTPMDVFVFVNPSTMNNLPTWLYSDFENLFILPIDAKSWEVPASYSPLTSWTSGDFGADYHLMGRWRLTFGPDFVRALGYKYMLAIDDDLFVLQNVPFAQNLVSLFDEQETAVAYRDKRHHELPKVSEGLPEIVKYWMVTRNVSAPWGPLLEDMTPPTMEGLSSKNWNRLTYGTAFHVVNMDYWFEPPVQDFLNLIFTTGGDLMQRWLEQGVINMMRLLFLQERNVYKFPQNSMIHEKVFDPRTFKLLQCTAAKGLQEAQQARQYYQINDVKNEIREVEFLIIWQQSDFELPLSELYLFHWMYNASSCGADTYTLNDYKWYEDDAYLSLFDWWRTSNVNGRLQTLIAGSRGGGEVDISQGASTMCAETIRKQLEEYSNFFCVYTGSILGNPLSGSCEAIRQSALNMMSPTLM